MAEADRSYAVIFIIVVCVCVKAFTSGRLSVAGNMMLAMRLESLFANKSKL